MSTTPTAPEPVVKTRSQHINDSYADATIALREKYLTEFNAARVAYLAKVGITDWKPRPSDEEKAAAEIAALLRKFPDLAEQFRVS